MLELHQDNLTIRMKDEEWNKVINIKFNINIFN